MDPNEVRRLLDGLRDAPAPPSSASVLTAVAQGRRRVRRHRLAATALSGGMALVVVAGGVAIAGGSARLSTGSAALPTATATTTAPPATAGPHRFDPRLVQAHIGWMPPGLQVLSMAASELSFTTGYQYKPPPGGHSGDSVVSLMLKWPGAPKTNITEGDWPTTPAPPVNGHPAVWVHAPVSAGTVVLRWSFGAGGAATVIVGGLRGGLDAQATTHRIAGSVHIRAAEPIRAPFHLAHVPAGRSLSSLRLQIQDDVSMPWEASLILSGRGPSINVRVFAKPACECDGKFDTTQNTTINDTPAWVVDGSVTLYFGPVIAELTLVPDRNRRDQDTATPPDLAELAAALTVYPNRTEWRAPLGP
jgi:hypothetical protein